MERSTSSAVIGWAILGLISGCGATASGGAADASGGRGAQGDAGSSRGHGDGGDHSTHSVRSEAGTANDASNTANPRSGSDGGSDAGADCWQLLAVDRVRLRPLAGQEAAMVGGTIQGSHESATNGFAVLATIETAPSAGQWTELSFANATPYRYVKYYGSGSSYGRIAELQFFHGDERITGAGFGTAGSANPWQNAFDDNTDSYFEGATDSDAYVGMDLAAEHVVSAPIIAPSGGSFATARTVTLRTTTDHATIRYTTNGDDPTAGAVYSSGFQVTAGSTTVRAIATADCSHPSSPAIALFTIGGTSATEPTSLHVGNSLTDTLEGYLLPLAIAGGINLDYHRYTVPGIGTWVYGEAPTGGFGVANVQDFVQGTPLDHLSFQPFRNMPCLPTGHEAEADYKHKSDAVNIEQAWADAHGQNPAVQLWVYEAWPQTPNEHGNASGTEFRSCLTGGEYYRDRAIWDPSVPDTWEQAQANQLLYNERVRAGLIAMHPSWPPPYIVPAGSALAKLKSVVERGDMPGVATDAFWPTYFMEDGTDNHLTNDGRYLVNLVFYAVMFQEQPAGLPHANTELTDAQAMVMQQLAWDTVTAYALSGVTR